eukprot:5800024-Alexandrium_andersonii.AAC.1
MCIRDSDLRADPYGGGQSEDEDSWDFAAAAEQQMEEDGWSVAEGVATASQMPCDSESRTLALAG